MKIDKAIELIQKDIDDKDVDWNSPLGKAYKMSFEALKRLQEARKKVYFTSRMLLPGETKEGPP